MDTEVKEIIAELTADTLTPPATVEPTVEQKAQIRVLLEAGYSPCDIFTKAYLPLEWAVAEQEQIAFEKAEAEALLNPVVLEPIIE
jgi:hypothetical protein